MAKSMKIIGVCPFCHRDVGNDMRPINNLDPENMDRLLEEMEIMRGVQPSTSDSLATESSEGAAQVPSSLPITLHDQQISFRSAVPFTEHILGMVKTEFERAQDAESVLTADQAMLIVTTLREEQHTYGSFLNSLLKKKRGRPKRE